MVKILGSIILALFLLGGAIITGYLSLKQMESDSFPFFLLVTLPLIGGCAFLLYKASQSNLSVGFRPAPELAQTNNEFEAMLEKNNAMADDFGKTAKARNELHLVQAASDAESRKS